MSESVLEGRKARARTWFEALRDDICAALETVETDLPTAQPVDSFARPGRVPITAAQSAAAA